MKNLPYARLSWKGALNPGSYGQCMTQVARGDTGQNFKNFPVVPRTKTKLDIKNSKLFYIYCKWHFFCYFYRPPKVYLNWYPRICNPYRWDIQLCKCQWTQAYQMAQSESQIKISKIILHVCNTSFATGRDPPLRSWFELIPKDL